MSGKHISGTVVHLYVPVVLCIRIEKKTQRNWSNQTSVAVSFIALMLTGSYSKPDFNMAPNLATPLAHQLRQRAKHLFLWTMLPPTVSQSGRAWVGGFVCVQVFYWPAVLSIPRRKQSLSSSVHSPFPLYVALLVLAKYYRDPLLNVVLTFCSMAVEAPLSQASARDAFTSSW